MKSVKSFIFIASLLALASAGLNSCKNGPIGIFASVAGETPIGEAASSGFKSATPSFVIALGENYYAGIGKLWSRNIATGLIWSPVDTVPANAAYADSAVTNPAGTAMFVSFKDSQGASAGVWAFDGTSWTRLDAAFPPAGTTLQRLMAANDGIFAVCSMASAVTSPVITYTVYHSNGTTDFAAIPSLTDISKQPTAIAYDPAAARYALAAGTQFYAGTAALAFTGTDFPPAATLTGIIYDADLGLIATSDDGRIHQSADGITWVSSTVFTKNSIAYYFSQPLVVPAALGGAKRLLVGTDSRYISTVLTPSGGYLDFDVSTPAIATWSAAENINKTPISDAINFDTSVGNYPVTGLYLIDSELFACTGSLGLWSNTYTASAWSKWQRESDK